MNRQDYIEDDQIDNLINMAIAIKREKAAWVAYLDEWCSQPHEWPANVPTVSKVTAVVRGEGVYTPEQEATIKANPHVRAYIARLEDQIRKG